MDCLKTNITREFLGYIIVGGLTALLNMGLIALTVGALGLSNWIGMSIAYLLSAGFHFVANRFTFRALNNPISSQGPRYLSVLILNYLITISVVYILVTIVGVSIYLSAAIAMVVTAGVGYLALKFWVFQNKKFAT